MHTYTQVGCLRAFDNVVSDNNFAVIEYTLGPF